MRYEHLKVCTCASVYTVKRTKAHTHLYNNSQAERWNDQGVDVLRHVLHRRLLACMLKVYWLHMHRLCWCSSSSACVGNGIGAMYAMQILVVVLLSTHLVVVAVWLGSFLQGLQLLRILRLVGRPDDAVRFASLWRQHRARAICHLRVHSSPAVAISCCQWQCDMRQPSATNKPSITAVFNQCNQCFLYCCFACRLIL